MIEIPECGHADGMLAIIKPRIIDDMERRIYSRRTKALG